MDLQTGSSLVQVMVCHPFGTKLLLPETMITYYQLVTEENTSVKFESEYKYFLTMKYIWKHHLQYIGHFVPP